MKPYWTTLLSIGIFTLFVLSPAEAVVRVQQPVQAETVPAATAQHRKLTRSERRAMRKEARQARREMRRAMRAANTEKEMDGFARAAFVSSAASLAVLWVFSPLAIVMMVAGIVLGIIGLIRIKRNSDKLRGKTLAWLGIGLGLGALLLTFGFIALLSNSVF